MKMGILLNSEISYIIAKMGHNDELVIGDAGLPIPNGVQRIDLAVSKGIPDFLSVLEAILNELRIEKIILATEIKNTSSKLHSEILELLHLVEKRDNISIELEYVSHEEFKIKTADSKAVVRTGEFASYANIILVSGVVF